MHKQLRRYLTRWLLRPTIRLDEQLASLREHDPDLERTLIRRVRRRLREARHFG